MATIFANIIAIYRKELSGYFVSPLAMAIAGLFWLIARRFVGGMGLVFGCTLFAASPALIYLAGTAKPYATDVAAILPGARRTASRTLSYEANDVETLFRAMLAFVKLGGTAG